MSKTYEMMWDCTYCDAKKLLGKSHRFCPSCGAAQDPTKRYFPPDSEKIAVEDHQYVGKDKICSACDAPNSSKSICCCACGAPLDGSKEVKLQGEEETPPPPPTPQKSFTWVIIAIVGFIIGLIILFSMTESKKVHVTQHSWNRSIELERYKTVQEEDWKSGLSSSAKIIHCRSKEKSTEKVPDGEKCETVKKDNGDGTYNENEQCHTIYKDVPVYADWCTYEQEKWVVFDTEKSTNTGLQPTWPTIHIQKCSITAINCEREGNRSEEYIVHMEDENSEKHTCSFEEDIWKQIKDGDTRTMEFGSVTGNIDCSSWFSN